MILRLQPSQAGVYWGHPEAKMETPGIDVRAGREPQELAEGKLSFEASRELREDETPVER